MSNTNIRNQAEKSIKENPYLAEEIYRAVWKQHVVADTKSRIEDAYSVIPEDKRDEVADNVAEAYVYEGEYDCTHDYWSNLDNLIEDLKYQLG